ncbi:HNH endonuclease signature motif containing protein [Glutamicibacter arilaitensis]|uniref:HNH endonuclease n=1 Tax=Glutamicibacter arilaitensis TaxID=256701 RepID=A0A4Y8TUE1_9MICC|nr:HNH endonuclease signature motif containing protein [Glutamicibacter arilaitensis]TFH54867.1 HNH endonuclease [Glutamicibacter arilaitensis]
MSREIAQALKDLADANALAASATHVLAQGGLTAGQAAYLSMLAEDTSQSLARTQVHAAAALRRTGAHKLDQESFQAISDLGAHPTVEQIEAAKGRTTTARTHFKDAKGLMTGWLDIPRSTAAARLVQADCLLGGTDEAGQPTDPWLPELATQFDDPSIDPRLVASAAMKLHSLRKDLGEGKAAEAKKQQLQAESAAFLRSEPKSARKHINDMVSQIKAGQRPLKALLDGIGIFKRGMRKGLVEYIIRVLPSHAAYIEAYFANLDNPSTVAGNREGLKDVDAQFTGEESSGWDDEESKPDWAKDGPGDEAMEDIGDLDSEDENLHCGNDELQPEAASAEAKPANAEWEELKPERRRLVGFMALLMSERKHSGGPPEQQSGLASAQVSVILDWDKLQQRTEDFAVTSSGILLSPGETRTALCNAGILPVVLKGKSLPLDLGRTQRLFTKAQVRALRAAYRGCSYPGCSMPAQRCEADHLDPWEKGGRTDIKSAVLNCLIHHTARHCGLFQAVKIPGSRPMVLLPPELDPEQNLRINTYFMTPAEGLEAEALAEETTVKRRAGLLDVEIAEP